MLRALSAYGMVMGLAAVGGQLLGGALLAADPAGLELAHRVPDQHPDRRSARWRWCGRSVPESRAPSRRTDRRRGHGAGDRPRVTAIVLPLVEGQAHGWPLWTWLSLAAAPLLLAAFALQQRRLAAPRRRADAGARAVQRHGRSPPAWRGQLVFWCGQASFFLVLALYLQQGRGLSPLDCGPGVHDHGRRLPGDVDARSGTDRAPRPPGAGVRRAGAGRRPRAAVRRGRPGRHRRLGVRARPRSDPGRRRHGARDHAAGDAGDGGSLRRSTSARSRACWRPPRTSARRSASRGSARSSTARWTTGSRSRSSAASATLAVVLLVVAALTRLLPARVR